MTLVSNVTSAQEFLYNTIDISDGLPSNEAYRVYQTSDGFYWLLTDSGLVRYDGNQMKVFDVSNGLPSDDVFKVHEDECGRLWVMSQSSDLCFIRNGEVTVIETNSKLKPYVFWSDENGVWFYNYEFIYHISCQNDNIEKNQFVFADKLVLPIAKPLASIRKGNNFKKLVTIEGEYKLFAENSKDRVLPSYSAGMAHGAGYIIVPRSDSLGIYLVLNLKNNTYKIDSIQDYIATDIALIVQYNKLLKEFSFHAREKVTVYDSLLNYSESFSLPNTFDGELKFNAKDNIGGQWITAEKGFTYYSFVKKRTSFQEDLFFNNRAILNLEIAGGILFGSDVKGKILSQNVRNNELAFNNDISYRGALYNMIYANQGLYVSSKNEHVKKWSLIGKIIGDQEAYGFKQFSGVSKNPSRVKGKKIAAGESCFCGIGLSPYQFNENLEILFEPEVPSFSSDVEYDSKNKMFWISQSDAIVGYKECKNELDTIVNIAGVREMFVLPDGMLLNTIDKKIYNCVDTICEEVENIKLKIQSVVNANGTILIATTKSIYEFDVKTQKLEKVYHAYDSKSTQTINDLEYNSGKLYVATTEGVFSCYTDLLKGYRQDMKAIITSPDVDTTIQIDYVDNSLAIDYTCITLENHENLHFEYTLKPVQDKLTKTNLRSINFAELAPHNYTFEVTAVNELGDRSNTAILKFEVKSPWFMTWWFYCLLALISISSLYFLFLLYKRRVDKKAALDQKFAELELNALQSQMNPHFVFNTLNSIQNLIGAYRIGEADKYLSKFAQLMRKFLELSKSKFITLEEELIITKEYLELEQLRFGEKLSFEVSAAEELQNLDVMVPATLIQPFVENALIHGLFHKQGNGFIKVNAEVLGHDLIISIEDDGIGLEAANKIKRNRRIEHISRGGELITQRLEVLKKLQNYEVQIFMKDLSIDGRSGTRVEIIITNFIDRYSPLS